MYLLEGTQKIRATYKLGPGDVIQFGKNADGQLVVAGRKGTKGDQQRKPPSSRGPSPANATAGDKPQTAVKRKRGSQGAKKPAQFVTDGETYYFDPIKDSVFRAIPDGLSDEPGKVIKHNGVSSVILNVCGELYQAYFDSSAAAHEAFNASGGLLPA